MVETLNKWPFPFVCGCRWGPISGDLHPWGAAAPLAAHHRCVWEAVASLPVFLPSAGGAAHSVQHSPHLRGGLVNQRSSGAKKWKFINCTNSTRMYSFDTFFLVINLLFRMNSWKCD